MHGDRVGGTPLPRIRLLVTFLCTAHTLTLRRLIAMTLVAVVGVHVGQARADGDPGSDVLVYQPSFVGADAGVSVPEQLQLSDLLKTAAGRGVPVRVAVIAHRDDLGAITALWRRPQTYAHFLGIELSLAYTGRLVVVMPNGLGFFWDGQPTSSGAGALRHIAITPTGSGLITAAETAVTRLAAATGVTLTPRPIATGSGTAGAAHGTATIPTIVGGAVPRRRRVASAPRSESGEAIAIVAVVALLFVVLAILARGGRRRTILRRVRRTPRTRIEAGDAHPWRRWALPAATGTAVAVLGAGAVIALTASGGSTASALITNPYLDPGTTLAPRRAPNFTLYDQTGHRVSLKSFRGKVTILAFNDSECTTICPLTTSAMLDAKRTLGAAGDKVQLLGIDANPKAIQIEDVLSYTQLHGLVGKWDFLTGSLPQLKSVWHKYHVQADIERGLISHTPAIYMIDPQGRLRELYMTQQSYASVDQLGQILAREASTLLPGHPAIHSDLSYTPAPSTPPTRSVSVPRAGGGHITLGPGKPHLYMFFDTWDREVSGLAGKLDAFDHFAGHGLPQLTAVDEGSVEPSPRALPAFLRTLPHPLTYPVAIDTTGAVADGYEVQGVPWLVLTSATGKILWYDEIIDSRWPTVAKVSHEVHAALAKSPGTSAATNEQLLGSPAPLAELHRQASHVIGTDPALMARIKALRGYPIVVNIWASWCLPCQAEFGLLATASAQYGRQVAFLGADTDDPTGDAGAFLAHHHVSYPSYSVGRAQLDSLLPGGVEGYPTTVFINRNGKVVDIHTGQYDSQGTLDSDIKSYALR